MIVITDYDPNWPKIFEALKNRLSSALGDLAASIEHVGSTAVPGLAAKPIIDLDVLLARHDLPEAIARLATLGYQYQGDLGIPDREAFLARAPDPRHHLYVCPPTSREFRRHIAFRDYLRANQEAVSRYAGLKRSLAAKFPNDWAAYTNGKSEFVARALALPE